MWLKLCHKLCPEREINQRSNRLRNLSPRTTTTFCFQARKSDYAPPPYRDFEIAIYHLPWRLLARSTSYRRERLSPALSSTRRNVCAISFYRRRELVNLKIPHGKHVTVVWKTYVIVFIIAWKKKKTNKYENVRRRQQQ